MAGASKDATEAWSILDPCISRFDALAKLQGESQRARSDLEESRSIDCEKGLSRKAKGLSEHEACKPMWSAAMHENDKIAEIAQLTIPASEQSK